MDDRKYTIDDFTRKGLQQHYDTQRGAKLAVWSPVELTLLGRISPLTVKHVNDFAHTRLPYDQSAMIEQAKILACYITNTLDNLVFKGIQSVGAVQGRIRNLGKIFEILGEECPIKIEDVTQDNILDMIFQVKSTVFDFASRFEQNYPLVAVHKNGSKPFVPDLVKVLGDGVQNIILYGSSANGNGSDYDLLIVTEGYDRGLYDRINGKLNDVPADKHLGLLIMPSSHLPRYAAIDDYSYVISRESRIIFGENMQFPQMPEFDSIQKMYYKISHDITTLRGVLMDDRTQTAMATTPDLRRDMFKKEIWILRGLAQVEQGRYIPKDEVVRTEGFSMPQFEGIVTQDMVREKLFDANYRVKQRIETHMKRLQRN